MADISCKQFFMKENSVMSFCKFSYEKTKDVRNKDFLLKSLMGASALHGKYF